MKFYTNVQQSGNSILVRGYEHGQAFQTREKFNPTLFLPSAKKEEWKTLEGRNVRPVKQGTIKDAKKFIEDHKEIEDFKIYGQERFLNQFIYENYRKDVLYDMSKIRIFNIDIETGAENGFPDLESADQEILLISVKDSEMSKITVFGARPFTNKDPEVQYLEFSTEEGLLKAFLHWWSTNYPDVVTGWNVQLFDIPYIYKRIERLFGEKEARLLSPWKTVMRREIYIKGRKNIAYDISGVSCLDYLELYKKFTYKNQESYRLDYIALVELGQQKLDHSEFDTFKEFYTKDWEKFVLYNIHDVRLVQRLDDKMKLLELAIGMAYDAKVNFEDVYSQVRMWDNIIYVYLAEKKIAIPPKKSSIKENFVGGYVKPPTPGLYDWVVSFDLNSLYPHLIMQYNMSPETLLPHKHPSANMDNILYRKINTEELCGQCLAANGTYYDTTKHGFLPEIMDKIYSERKVYKKKMLEAKKIYERKPSIELKKEISRYDNIQMARKIQLNSAYGAIGNEHFRYFRKDIAEAITTSGQVSIQWVSNDINRYLNNLLNTEGEDYVIACDTDSMYLNLGPLVERVFKGRETSDEKIVDFIDKICEMELAEFIESSFQKLADYVNAYEQKMEMKRENIARRGFWTRKKRYVLSVWDSEGTRYETPKMKVCGMESQRSSTPGYFRDKLLQVYDMIINQDNETVLNFIAEVKQDVKKQNLVDISFPRGCNNLEKYSSRGKIYEKGTPIQVRAALLYNHYLRQYKLDYKYPLIQEGEKIKFIYLREPNPIGEDVIGFFGDIPKELGLDEFVDYKLQFEKSFFEPVKTVLECVGWESEKRISLLQFT